MSETIETAIDDIETATSILKTMDDKEKMKLELISKEVSQDDLSPDLFSLLQGERNTMVLFQLIETDKTFQPLDELLQSAASVVSGDTQMEKQRNWGDPVEENDQKSGIVDGFSKNLLKDGELKSDSHVGLAVSSSTTPHASAGTEKMSLMEVAALFESYAENGATVLDLKGKLMDKVEWLPLSLGNLSNLTEINISKNEIMALPSNIGELKALKKLDIHSNQLINLPISMAELINLTDLDLHANRLKSLPASFGNLEGLINLDLSSNQFTQLPDLIGNMSSLEKLNLETNELEELPYTIGSCTSLLELRLDFNRLKALPEEIGNLENLEFLTLRYNRVKNLPTTMGNLLSLEELNLSFNELEYIPESLCSALRLRKLNVANNFTDLKTLPRSIGNLKMLEELDISNDQIRVLPDSFGFLSRLRVFLADETPLEIPPRETTNLEAQAVVQYMAEVVDEKNKSSNRITKKMGGFWFCILSVFCVDELFPTEGN